MPRYRLQEKDTNDQWVDTNITFNSKLELDCYIGEYNIDYEYRVGYFFKHFNKPISRFVWDHGEKSGQEVKVTLYPYRNKML